MEKSVGVRSVNSSFSESLDMNIPDVGLEYCGLYRTYAVTAPSVCEAKLTAASVISSVYSSAYFLLFTKAS